MTSPRKKLVLLRSAVWGYPEYKMSGKHKRLHVILAKIFIPNLNPDVYTVVDHLDRNKENYSLNNLRWSTIKENANNIHRPRWTGEHIFEAFSDKEKTISVIVYNEEDLFNKYSSTTIRSNILSASRNETSYLGYYWKVEDIALNKYLSGIGKTTNDIDNTKWVLHYSGKFYVHPLGLIKPLNKRVVSAGSLCSDGRHPERRYNSTGGEKVKSRVHDLVAEVFLNDNKPLDATAVVDHLNGNSVDNRSENLRICTQSENMKNPNTLKKLSRKIIDDTTGEIFSSITECAKAKNVSINCIWQRVNGIRPAHGIKYLEEDNQDIN